MLGEIAKVLAKRCNFAGAAGTTELSLGKIGEVVGNVHALHVFGARNREVGLMGTMLPHQLCGYLLIQGRHGVVRVTQDKNAGAGQRHHLVSVR